MIRNHFYKWQFVYIIKEKIQRHLISRLYLALFKYLWYYLYFVLASSQSGIVVIVCSHLFQTALQIIWSFLSLIFESCFSAEWYNLFFHDLEYRKLILRRLKRLLVNILQRLFIFVLRARRCELKPVDIQSWM